MKPETIEEQIERNVHGLVNHIKTYAKQCATEEAAKHALVLPFLHYVLCWNIFNSFEVVPEFVADIGLKKGEKVDYALFKEGKLAFIMECKMPGAKLERDHSSQLFRYFTALTACKIAILTDGIRYLFYTDSDNPNVLDDSPFFVIDFTKPELIMIEELKHFTREFLNLDNLAETANHLKYSESVKAYLVRQLETPTDEFVRLLINASDANAKVTTKNIDIMRGIVRKSLHNLIQNKVHQALKTSQSGAAQEQHSLEVNNGAVSSEASNQAASAAKEIVTTAEEWEGFYTVRALLYDVVKPERVQPKDTLNYFNVLLDGNTKQQICRFYFNTPKKYLGLFTEDGEQKKEITSLADLYLHKQAFEYAAAMHDKKPYLTQAV